MHRCSYKSVLLLAGLCCVAWMVWHWLHSVGDVQPAEPALVPIGINEKKTPARSQARFSPEDIRLLEEAVSVPIVFYGEVVDWDDVPLKDVKISYDIIRQKVAPNPEAERLHTTSNAEGKFIIEGTRGTSLDIGKLEKEGFRTYFHAAHNYEYAAAPDLHHPDASKPVRFILAPAGDGDEVLEWDVDLAFKWTDPPKRYDLATGQPSDSGELEMVPRRKRFSEKNRRDFDWCFDLNVRGGGLIVIDPRKGAVAPRDGYAETVSLGRGYADRPNLMGATSVSLCVKNAAGRYGLLKLTVYPERSDTSKYAGSLTGSWNPTGSRVVEKERPVRDERGR